MKTKSTLLFLLILFVFSTSSQEVFQLWEGQEMPYYKENQLKEYEKEAYQTQCVFNITQPTLTVYSAKGENSGQAVVVIPGGGYSLVAMYHEGYDVAKALAEKGITAAVLKYRLPKSESSDQPQFVPLSDARRAIHFLRDNSEKYGIEKNKIGVMGFSAGSHLSTVASLWKSENEDENPNFSGLIYGVTNLSEENKQWLEETLYRRKMTKEEITANTLLDLVTKDTPPAFLVHACDDDVCKLEETTLYFDRLIQNNVLVEMHIFPKGGHGFGLGRKSDGTDQWLPLFANWIKNNF